MNTYELCEKIIKIENKISDIQEYVTISKQTENEKELINKKLKELISEKEKEIKTLKKQKKEITNNTVFQNMSYSELHKFREEHKPKTTEKELFDFKKEEKEMKKYEIKDEHEIIDAIFNLAQQKQLDNALCVLIENETMYNNVDYKFYTKEICFTTDKFSELENDPFKEGKIEEEVISDLTDIAFEIADLLFDVREAIDEMYYDLNKQDDDLFVQETDTKIESEYFDCLEAVMNYDEDDLKSFIKQESQI